MPPTRPHESTMPWAGVRIVSIQLARVSFETRPAQGCAPRATAGGCRSASRRRTGDRAVANETRLDRCEMDGQRPIPIMAGTSNDRTGYEMSPNLMMFYRMSIGPALAAMVLTGCGSAKPAPTAPPPQVSVVTVHRASVPITTELPGRTSPYLVAQVRARVDGIVLKREFKEGSEVKAGQRLYQIDPAPYIA